MTAAEYMSHHPAIALSVCGANLVGTVVLRSLHIPEIVMQSFQIAAWTMTILVGLITVISWGHRVYKTYIKK